jgi:cyclophilin family peptidyl-prolyl cis-trans isomerase
MAKNMIKKTLCLALATVSACASLVTMTACETSHPEVAMTLSFNGKTYQLDYNLNRKLTPATVKHFLALVEAGFYNGLCVHDYQTSNWYTGAYEYKEDTSKLVYRPYLDAVKKIDEKGNFSHTVWEDMGESKALYTLYGEFKSNSFEVQNGKVSNGFGSLTMRYTDKADVADTLVWVKRANDTVWKDYGYNSATSMFSINVSTTSTSLNDYCTFAELDDGSVETLEDLKAAITNYIGEQNEDAEFTVETEAVINAEDAYMHEDEVFFNTPVKPIVIETITVTKW